jgi:hypothetical protein
VGSHRFVGRALLEASDIFKAATKEVKRAAGNDQEGGDMDGQVQQQQLKMLRTIRKKLEFFLSWTLHPDTIRLIEERQLRDEIIAWRDEWKTTCLDVENGTKMSDLNLDFLGATNRSSQPINGSTKEDPRPLLVEVQSRRIE